MDTFYSGVLHSGFVLIWRDWEVTYRRVHLVTSQSLQINRYGLVVTHPAVVLYKR